MIHFQSKFRVEIIFLKLTLKILNLLFNIGKQLRWPLVVLCRIFNLICHYIRNYFAKIKIANERVNGSPLANLIYRYNLSNLRNVKKIQKIFKRHSESELFNIVTHPNNSYGLIHCLIWAGNFFLLFYLHLNYFTSIRQC